MTPIRRQYLSIKQRYPNAILLFRLGDFYETFDDDAKLAAKALDIVLTSRSMGKGVRVPMAGIPAHSVESYLAKLIEAGHRVAICEQLSDPSASKGIVDRNVVRVVTPGTVVEPSMLDQQSNNYLAALQVSGTEAGLAYIDITTGEFAVTQLPLSHLPAEINRLSPAELLVPEGDDDFTELNVEVSVPLSPKEFHASRARETLLAHFGALTLEAYGCENLPLAVGSAGAILGYLGETQPQILGQVSSLKTYSVSEYMTLDPQSRRNLELFDGGRWGEGGHSLLSTLDFTRTAMGARLLRRWIGQPLLNMDDLGRRLDGTTYFHSNLLRRQELRSLLSRISDLERIMSRVRLGSAPPRDLLALKESLRASAAISPLLEGDETAAWLRKQIRTFGALEELLESALKEEATGNPGDGEVLKEGFSEELDELRSSVREARRFIAGLERREKEATGIRTLKVGYNRVFGYYIEVRKSNLDQVPSTYERRQTLTNGERFIIPELKGYEARILDAQERIQRLEQDLYSRICVQVGQEAKGILELAHGIALTDVLSSFAEAADNYGYVRPDLVEEPVLDVRGGRHPMAERILPAGAFVPNDLHLSTDEFQLLLITGPNMSGKSTYIRQAALIVLMAQIGSFVPADSATIGVADRIFTRVGLQDDLAAGQSTFMVEMVETAAILNQATQRSLVILDEIGRGTSTYDGLSIARAVAEHIHNDPKMGCRTLFATHYHELTQLAESLPRVQNHTVAVSESGGQLVFLHRIVPGGADRSYGVHVAQLAGLPQTVVHRAWEILEALESLPQSNSLNGSGSTSQKNHQIPLFSLTPPLVEELLKLDVTNMTPLEAINKLYELQSMAKESG